MDSEMLTFVDTLLCSDISTSITGQLALELMINPPIPGDPSYDTYTQVKKHHVCRILHHGSFSCLICLGRHVY